MKINNAQEYKESLRSLGTRIFVRGERVRDMVEHPILRPHINAAAETYNGSADPFNCQLLGAASHITGKPISRFTHIPQSADDLVRKVKMMRLLGQSTGTCFQRCVGMDGLISTYNVSHDIDAKYGADYHQRFLEYLKGAQETNYMICGAMTDPKGDRSLPPSKQPDPDMYLHVVKREKNGIVIRGAKLHQTGGANSHEVLVMPTTALKPEEKDYAVVCAVPANAKGLTMIFGRQSNDTRKVEPGDIDVGNPMFGAVGGEATIIFDDVFVPYERVFMCGETDFAGQLVEMFASYHRQNYGGCKGGVGDVIIGAAASIAEYHGIGNSSHIRDKITEMINLVETSYACSLACSADGRRVSSGAYYVNQMLANVAKQNITRHLYEVCRLAQDIAGGFIATMPSEDDLRSKEIGHYVEKYFASAAPAEKRMRMGRLIENITSATPLVEAMHGAGSPQAQRIMIYRQANLEAKKKAAQFLAGIK